MASPTPGALRRWHLLSIFLGNRPTASLSMAPDSEGWDVVIATWLMEEADTIGWLADLPGDASEALEDLGFVDSERALPVA
eukprot:13721520-Alexandrium_andersonii.AAC.1